MCRTDITSVLTVAAVVAVVVANMTGREVREALVAGPATQDGVTQSTQTSTTAGVMKIQAM